MFEFPRCRPWRNFLAPYGVMTLILTKTSRHARMRAPDVASAADASSRANNLNNLCERFFGTRIAHPLVKPQR